MQICTLMDCYSDVLVSNVIPCQQQNNSVGCGIFALTFSYYILNTVSVEHITMCSEAMQEHFLKCV